MNKNEKIIRIWRGWTSPQNAPIYENMLIKEIFPTIKGKGVDGLEKVRISTKEEKEEVTFFLVLQFDSLDSVKKFAGEDYEKAYIPDEARQVLLRYEDTAQHFTLKAELLL